MEFEGKNVLVTGGAGFIGSHLVDRLIEAGARVTVLDNLLSGKNENLNAKANFVNADVRNLDEIKEWIERKDIIYHLAASTTTKESALGWDAPLFDFQINAIGTLNILLALRELKVESRLVFISSGAVYGNPEYFPTDEKHPTNPISPYGISKLTSEKYVIAFNEEYGIKSVILRLFNTYGPRQTHYVMYDFLEKLEKNPDRLDVLGIGTNIRDFTYISDTVTAILLAGQGKTESGEIFNVASGNAASIAEIAEMTVRILGLEGKTGIHYTGDSWKGDIATFQPDISKIKTELGFKPGIKLDMGLSLLKNWYTEMHT